MKNGQSRLYEKLLPDVPENQLLVADVVRYLLGLAKLHEHDKTGNRELSEGLRCVAQVLRPYANCSVIGLSDTIKKKSSAVNSKISSNKAESVLPSELESISQEDIERILDDESYTKQQVAELGARRFGISRSKLERLRKKDAQDSVRAALEHEKSLDVISREASRGGKARSS